MNKSDIEKRNLEKLNQISSKATSGWQEKARKREENKEQLEHSFQFALRVLRTMRSKKISQKVLADRMNVSPQYISKVLSGGENISFETVGKFERALEAQFLDWGNPPVYYIMRIPSGSAEFDYVIKGQKAESSYISSLQNKPEMASLFVKANEHESIESASGFNVCSQ